VTLFHDGNVLVKWLSVLFLRNSTCLSLHRLAVCDWVHIPTVFVMAKFSRLNHI